MSVHWALYVGGAGTTAIGLLHITYPWLFKWTRDFPKLPRLQVKLLYTLHVALLLAILFFGVVTIVYAEELLEPGLGRTLLAFITALWAWRLVWQLTYWRFTPEEKARPKIMRMHWAFTGAFVVILAAYAWALVQSLR